MLHEGITHRVIGVHWPSRVCIAHEALISTQLTSPIRAYLSCGP